MKIKQNYFIYCTRFIKISTMRKLVYCCLFVFILMACGERNAIQGHWAMEFEGTGETFVVMADDSICSSELQFGRDTIYMNVKSDGMVASREFIGKYKIENDLIKLTDRYGVQKDCIFAINEDVMTVFEKDRPDKAIMRLRRIKEEG